MSDIEKLSHAEKVFLAGCIKTAVMADGNISTDEIDSIDDLYAQDNFSDYSACLSEFESKVKTSDDFWNMARSIINKESQEIILNHIGDFELQDGITNTRIEDFLVQLKSIWD
jgi:hypothetical protein